MLQHSRTRVAYGDARIQVGWHPGLACGVCPMNDKLPNPSLPSGRCPVAGRSQGSGVGAGVADIASVVRWPSQRRLSAAAAQNGVCTLTRGDAGPLLPAALARAARHCRGEVQRNRDLHQFPCQLYGQYRIERYWSKYRRLCSAPFTAESSASSWAVGPSVR
jgi:hypothetical protein